MLCSLLFVFDICKQFYISPTTAYATLSLSSKSDLLFHGAPGACPTSYPLPRYVVAGGSGALNTSVTYGSLNSADNTAVLGTPILISPNPVAAAVDGLFSQRSDGPSVAYVKLAAVAPSPIPGAERQVQQTTLVEVSVPSSARSQPDAHRSLRMRTLPGKRHVAKEFLDESVVATMTRSRFKGRQTIISSAASVQPDDSTLVSTTTAAVFSLQSPLVLLRSEQPISSSAITNGGAARASLPAVPAGLFPAASATLFLSPLNDWTQLLVLYTLKQLTQQIPPTALPLSVLTGMSNAVGAATFVPSALLAEMAACPQHSYLVRSQQADTFSEQLNLTSSTELSSSQMPTPRAMTDIQQLCGSLKHSRSQPISSPTITPTPTISTTTVTVSSDPVDAVSGATLSAVDEYALGSGKGVPDVPNLFPESFSPQRESDDIAAIPADGSSTLGRSRFGPNPPKRSVSLTAKQITFAGAENDVDSFAMSQVRTGALNVSREVHQLHSHRAGQIHVQLSKALIDQDPKLANRTNKEHVSQCLLFGHYIPEVFAVSLVCVQPNRFNQFSPLQNLSLRFTTLTLLTLLWLLVAIVLGSPELNASGDRRRSDPDPVVRWNVIAAPLLHGESMPKDDDSSNTSPEVRFTIWLPLDMIPKGDSVRASHAGERKVPQAEGRRALSSIHLWLNASSRVEVRLSSPIERDAVHIYDVVNAHQILGTRVCRQRYACEHSCDPGARHDCICQRGYRPAGPKDRERLLAHGSRLGNIDLENVKGRICLDVDECASTEVRAACSRLGGVCTNRPGDYACLCPSGKPCLACRPLCISEEFEFAPCKASSNRVCKRKSLIPELIVPYKKNVWFENLQMVRDVVVSLTPDDLGRLPLNKSIVLDRSSGYQVRLDFDSLNLLPVLGPVDHSSGNDNNLFLASAAALDRTVAEPDAYRWSSATGQYHTVHAYTLKANNTLAKLCPYPVPPLYSLGIRAHRNVTTATVPDTSLPGHRPVLAGCRTYRRHGYFPPVEPESHDQQMKNVDNDKTLNYPYGIDQDNVYTGSERWSVGHGGQLNQVYRGLLNVQYTSGLEHLPDMVGGTDTMQSAYFWSKQTIPLVSGSAVNAAFDQVSSAATGAMYANTMHSVSSTELTSIQVWPSQPLGVSTAAWARLSGAPCAAADPLLEQLNLYTSALPPYIAMAETKLTLSLPKSSSLLGAVFSPASVERGQYLRASLALAWVAEDNLGAGEPALGSERPRTVDQAVAESASSDLNRRRYWVIDLTGQVDQFPGLFRLRVFPDNEEDSFKESGGPSANPSSSVRVFDYVQADVSSAEATVEVEGEDAFSDAADEVSTSEEPEEVPLADYDVGVFEERKFQLRILIPGPEKEPDYSKSFRVVITDAKHRLDIRVKRAVQEPDEMALRRSYERLPDDDVRPALVDLLPSLSARQQAVLQQASAGLLNSEANLDDSLSSTVMQQHTEPEWMYFGPPPSVVFSVIMTLILSLIVLFIGFVTQPDPTLAWAKLRSCTKSTDSTYGDEDHVALVPNPARYNSLLSRWCRVLLLIGYLCLKSAYTFGVTLTALVILIRYVTRDPTSRLTNIPEWTTGSQNSDFMGTSLTRQKLLQDAMDVHLRSELLRQQQDVKRMRDICDRSVEQMFDRMEEQLSAASKVAATRRSRVLLSQAVAELARVTAVASTLQLADGLMAFNQSTEWALHRLKSDLLETERALGNSEWLTALAYSVAINEWTVYTSWSIPISPVHFYGVNINCLLPTNHASWWRQNDAIGARIIYSEVVRLRGLTPDPTDPTRSFLQWAKLISPSSPSLEDLVIAGHLPRIEQPSLLPLLQPDHFQIPTPMMRASGSTVDGEEPEYGPQYVPFTSDPVEAEANEAHWMNYDTDPDVTGGLLFSDVMDPQNSQQQKPSSSERSSTSGADSTDTHTEVDSKLFANIQLGWMHVLGAALLLDAMWLIHRVLHTVDTAERLLYGEMIFVDLTAEGLRRRLVRKTRILDGCKRAFEAAMQPGAVRKLCGSVLALLVVTQGAAHLGRLLSQETLDYIGYYDNLILPVHLHARLVNVHVSRSAQRLNQYEVASLESETSRRLREAQFLLHQWTSWLNDIEQEQCRLLLAYKAAAQQVRTKISAKLTRNPSLSKVKLPVHVLHNGAPQPGSAQTDWTNTALGSGSSISKPVDALVPRHCRLMLSERQIELEDARRLDAPYCPLKAVVPRLFKGFNVIPKKVLFESDVSSWYPSREANQNF
ncbi:uncharacterized protein DEA37_0011433 [Paragonimus westermani]|uniref:TNFR-Cys domain-containing protein n=1 Tax=Paragonimus westermani TaxID=34504 RepID=A0A5J4NP04_9TREM|nr:uncharacterized protein DEA37_0011433 [Paragonimus westermani]